MCGRYAYTYSFELLQQCFGLTGKPVSITARYNVAPTQKAPVVRLDSDSNLKLDFLYWGLIPFFAVEPRAKSSMINARAETVAVKPSFKAAYKSRRCLVPASGFYEWKKAEEGPSQPYYIQAGDQKPLLFAGIYESWGAKEVALETFAIITTAANDLFKSIHERMPLILDTDQTRVWMDPNATNEQLSELLQPTAHTLDLYPVSKYVNNVKNDDQKCIERIEIEEN